MNTDSATKGKVATAFADLLLVMFSGKYPSTKSENLKRCIGVDYPDFKGDEQQDAEECMRALINCIHMDLPCGVASPSEQFGSQMQADQWIHFYQNNYSVISSNVKGITVSTTSCMHCSNISSSYELFSIISLPLLSSSEHQLTDALNTYLSLENLGHEWSCSACHKTGSGSLKVDFYHLPSVLIFQLKRFVTFTQKNDAYVRYPQSLNVWSATEEATAYDLVSVANHTGNLQFGHYFCFAKTKVGWYVYDDDCRVLPVTKDEVETTDAYMLIYERRTEVSTINNIAGSYTEDEEMAAEIVQREEEAIKLDDLSVSQMKELKESSEKHVFQAEVDRMMKLIINSLYKNKEIFLRELISNASDALDKIRFLSLTDKSALSANEDLIIRIKADKENHVLHVTDTGVGMTKDELVKNLGTIAKSGTSEFLSKLGDASSQQETSDLIGQFGVGFYSSFLVADRVVVTSKSNDDDQYIWDSDAVSFSVAKDPRGNTLGRGTTVSLHLKEEAHENLEQHKIKDLVKKYSQFINFPIYLYDSKVEKVGEPDEEVVKTVWDWILINENKPIWTKKPADVTDEEYTEFYKSFSRDHEDPMAKTHFTAEGEVTFRSILYIPKTSPADMFQNYGKKVDSIKMFVRRVFITDNFEDMMPKYLSFVRGVVDSDDLPLNVSRETLQQHKLLKVIKKKLVRKTLDMIKKISDDEYKTFWKEYSTNIKLGVMEDHSNRTRLAKLLRFFSSNSDVETTSLAEYVERMKEKQEHIYFIAGSSRMEVEKSPFVERLLKKGYEVIYLVEAVDEYCIQSLPEFEGKKFQNAAKEGLKLDESEKGKQRKEALDKEFEPLLAWMKDDALKDQIEKAVITERLTTSPCALVASSFGWSGNMERIMRAQAYQKTNDPNNQYYATQKKTLELNPRHPLVKELKSRVENNKEDQTTKDLAMVLFETATLRSGFALADTAEFAGRVERMLRLSMDISLDEKVEDEPEEEDAGEDEDKDDESKDEDEDTEDDDKTKEDKEEEEEKRHLHDEGEL